MKKTVVAGVLFATSFLSGCSAFTSPARSTLLEANKSYWMDYDASRRGGMVVSGTGTKICSEPAPDIALSLTNSLKGSLTAGNTSVTDGEATAAATVVALAGRDSAVLLAREALFRVCEASINVPLTATQVENLIGTIFTKVAEIATQETQKAQANAAIAGAQVEMMRQKAAIAAAAAPAK